MYNQARIEDTFQRIIDYLNANGMEINQVKTYLTEFMTKQKRARLRGILPELTVRERIKDKWEDKLMADDKLCRILGVNLQNNLSW